MVYSALERCGRGAADFLSVPIRRLQNWRPHAFVAEVAGKAICSLFPAS